MTSNELAALVADVRSGLKQVPRYLELGDVVVVTNHGHYVLKDAHWQPEKVNDSWNKDGLNGTVTGLVVTGGDTNRLFWATSFTDYSGTVKSFCFCYLPRIHAVGPGVTDLRPHFNLQTCG